MGPSARGVERSSQPVTMTGREVGGLVGEAADERRLPDPGLAGHAHQPTRAAPRRAEGARSSSANGSSRSRRASGWTSWSGGGRVHLAPLVASPLARTGTTIR